MKGCLDKENAKVDWGVEFYVQNQAQVGNISYMFLSD